MSDKRISDNLPPASPPSETSLTHVKEDWLRVVFNHANDGVLLIDPAQDRIMEANHRATEILGISAIKLSKTRPSELFPRFAELLPDLASNSDDVVGTMERVTFQSDNGDDVSVELSISSVSIEGQPCLITMLRDVTERNQAENRLRSSLRENSDLLARLENLYEEEQRITRQLRVVNTTAATVNSFLDPDQLLSYLARLLHETFGYYFVGIHLFNSGDDQLTLRATAGGPSPGRHAGFKAQIGTGIVGNSAKNGTVIVSNDVASDSTFKYTSALDKTSAEIAAPIKIGDRLLGVLDVQSEHVGAFTESSAETIQALANQLAVGLENARLFEETRELGVVGERNRLAREIHDGVAHSLVDIVWQLNDMKGQVSAGEELPEDRIDLVRKLANVALRDIRESVQDLRGQPERSLAESLRFEVERLSATGEIDCQLVIPGDLGFLPVDVTHTLLRVTQESLSNIIKHSGASLVKITVAALDGEVELTIVDNGRGIALDGSMPVNPGNGFGLTSMRDRAQMSGGNFTIDSVPGNGTTIRVTLPIQKADSA